MVSHYKLGELQVQLGQYEPAIERFQQGIAVLDTMIEKKLLVESATKEQKVLKQRIQFCQAATLATGDWDTLLKTDAKILPALLTFRATELAKRGKLTDVSQAGAKLRELAATAESGRGSVQKGGLLYNAACAYSLCATLTVKDKPQPTEAEQTERKKHLDLSLDCLKEAVAAGYDHFDHMQQDSDLTPLRELPEFPALLKQLTEKKPAPATKPNP